jgi:hypothetical protein
MTYNELMKRICSGTVHHMGPIEIREPALPILCKDGFEMSVQASEMHYCTPKINCDWYTSVEVGYPSEPEPLLNEYRYEEEDFYGWVPVEVVLEIILKHGGVAE